MKLIKQLKKQLLKDWGKRCEDYFFGCAICSVWRAYEELESAYFLTDDAVIEKTLNQKHK